MSSLIQMAEFQEQPDYDPALQHFLNFIKRNYSYEIIDPKEGRQLGPEFVAKDVTKAYFEENVQGNLKAILKALFPRDEKIIPDDILYEKIPIFSTLLAAGKGPWFEYFRRHDCPLPVDPNHLPANWPASTDANLLQRFCEEQWKFCVPCMTPLMDTTFQPKRTLPIVFRKELNTGSSARLWKIKIHPAYNDLVSKANKIKLGENADTFVLKTYYTNNAENYYNNEVSAFRRLKSEPHIIRFYGSFIRGDTYNVLLEYADKGTLEDFFAKVPVPVEGEQIILFWEAMFNLIRGLHSIHQGSSGTVIEPRILHGWHQDIKPANILVISNGSTQASRWKFKIADLGISHWHHIDSMRQDSSASDTYGTRTYGAPECCRPIAMKDKLRVSQNVDIWSLGCLFSEAARWIYNGYQEVEQYRQERRDETAGIPGLEPADCFHNGEEVLKTVQDSHRTLAENLRQKDYITKAVVEQMLGEMLDKPEARPTALALWHKSTRILEEARSKLSNGSQTFSPNTSTHTPNRGITYPPPAPPNPPPGFGPLRLSLLPHTYNVHNHEGSNWIDADRISPTMVSNGHIQSPGLLPVDINENRVDSYSETTRSLPTQAGPSRRRMRPSIHTQLDTSQGQTLVESEAEIQADSMVQTPLYEGMVSQLPNSSQSPSTRNNNSKYYRRSNQQTRGYEVGDQPFLESNDHVLGSPVTTPASATNGKAHQLSPQYSGHTRESSNVSSALSSPNENNNSALLEAIPGLSLTPSGVASGSVAGPSRHATSPVTWRIEDALKWRQDCKSNKKHKSMPNLDYLLRLKDRDHVFLIDDSATMNSHWEQVKEVLTALSYMLKSVDPNGLDLEFTVSEEFIHGCKRTQPLLDLMENGTMKGTTDMSLKLTRILERYQKELSSENSGFLASKLKRKVRPMNLYILTNGIWEQETNCEHPIQSLVQKLQELGKGRLQVGIQFISFGDEEYALARMNKLDSELHLDLDIVDHEPADGNVWKMLLGATNDTFDKVNETISVASRSSHEPR